MDIDTQLNTGHLLLESRVCRKCGEEKNLLDEYYRSRKDPSKASSYSYECKDCTKKRALKYHHQNSNHHGLSNDDYQEILNVQNNQCAICFTTQPGGKSGQFVVDYYDGNVRGLLCCSCYRILENLDGNIHTLENMVKYLHT